MLWYMEEAKEKDVIVSTRVRLARNLSAYPFGLRLTQEKAKEMTEKVTAFYQDRDGFHVTDMEAMSQGEALSLCERHYISREFAQKKGPHTLVREEALGLSIMVAEEDHLRLQCILNGYAPDLAFERVMKEEGELDRSFELAYSEKLGYLTHCPTNLGTAMRMSFMMHLPALTVQGRMQALSEQLQKLGLTVRGMYGEGSRAEASLYQISNQVTMGITEEETLRKMKEIVMQIAESERTARAAFKGETLEKLLDQAQRAEGLLRSARMISSSEFLSLYSAARLGHTIGNTSALSCETLDRMLFEVMPATMALSAQAVDTDGDLPATVRRDKRRAVLIQTIIADKAKKPTRRKAQAKEENA